MKNTFVFISFILLTIATSRIYAQQYNVNDAVLIDMYQNQHYKEAAEYLKQNCSEPITNIKILSRFAYTYQMAGKTLEAEGYYKRMYDIDSTNVPVLLSLAGINVGRENKPKAILYYQKVTAIDKQNFQVYRSLGRLYIQTADTANAYKNLLIANTIDPEEPYVASDLGSLLIAAKKMKQAEQVLVRALKADSTSLELLRQINKLYYTTNRFAETIIISNKIMKLGDQANEVINKLGASYYMLKNYECCIETFALMPEVYQTERTYYLTAMSYLGLKKYKEALLNFDNTLSQAISPYTNKYYNEIASIYDTTKQFKPATANYQKSLFFNENGLIYYSLANIYDKNLKDKKNAMKYYKKYLDSKPPVKQQEYITYVQSRLIELKK